MGRIKNIDGRAQKRYASIYKEEKKAGKMKNDMILQI
jgi:hypothetical protein